jgi:hypothetical protein
MDPKGEFKMKVKGQIKILRKRLIREAKLKPIHKFTRFDVFQKLKPEDDDDIMHADPQGDDLICSKTYELRRSDILRVYVPSGAKPMDIVRGLTKVIAWITQSPELITEKWGIDLEHPEAKSDEPFQEGVPF